MSQQQRFQIVKQGGPYEVVAAPKPSIEEDNEVIIKNKAAALQPLDWKQIDMGLMVEEWPLIIGLDGSGIVEEVGKGVTRFKPGDEVLGFYVGGPRAAAYQEYSVVKETVLAKKPRSWSFEEAASLGAGYVTALAAIYITLRIPLPTLPAGPKYKPQSVLILGGSSSVGASAIELFRIALPDAAILANSSSAHHERLQALGANKLFDRSATVEEIKEGSPDGKGVDVIFDAVNAVALSPVLLDSFDPNGPRIFAELVTGENMPATPPGVDHRMATASEIFIVPGIFEYLTNILETGQYKLPIPITLAGEGLDAIGKGIDQVRAGVSGTKVVARI